MEAFFDKYISEDLSELKGLEIKGNIPLRDVLLNDFLQEPLDNYQQDAAPVPQNHVYARLLKWTKVEAVSEAGQLLLKVDLTVNT